MSRARYIRMCVLTKSTGVFFIPVDLRWGLTAEESSRGDVIKLCLEEIDFCQPWFIGMLGNRYGWHRPPPGSDYVDEGLETTFETGQKYFPWIKNHPQASVTELELRHVLNDVGNLEREIHASFYLRDTARFLDHENVPCEDRGVFNPESEYASNCQDQLKDLIRTNGRSLLQSKLTCCRWPVLDGYSSLQQLGEQVKQDLLAAIEAEYPVIHLMGML